MSRWPSVGQTYDPSTDPEMELPEGVDAALVELLAAKKKAGEILKQAIAAEAVKHGFTKVVLYDYCMAVWKGKADDSVPKVLKELWRLYNHYVSTRQIQWTRKGWSK